MQLQVLKAKQRHTAVQTLTLFGPLAAVKVRKFITAGTDLPYAACVQNSWLWRAASTCSL